MILHAQDPMGAAAHNCAMMVSRFDLWLLHASSPTADRESRAASAAKVFAQWPKICRAMAELERVAKNASATGSAQDAQLQDFMEGRGG